LYDDGHGVVAYFWAHPINRNEQTRSVNILVIQPVRMTKYPTIYDLVKAGKARLHTVNVKIR